MIVSGLQVTLLSVLLRVFLGRLILSQPQSQVIWGKHLNSAAALMQQLNGDAVNKCVNQEVLTRV